LIIDSGAHREANVEELAEIKARKAEALQPGVPQEVSMRQTCLALLAHGVLGQVDPEIESIPGPTVIPRASSGAIRALLSATARSS